PRAGPGKVRGGDEPSTLLIRDDVPMAEAKKPKKNQAAARTNKPRGKGQAEPTTKHGALIRFPDKAAQLRAIMVLGEVQRPYHGFPGFPGVQYLVTNEHLEVLRKEEIPFEIL